MSRNLSDILQMYQARGPRLLDVGKYVRQQQQQQQQQPTMMRSDNTLVGGDPAADSPRPTTADAIDARSAMTHYSNDSKPQFPDTTGQRPGDLSDYMRLVKGLIVGSPEKLLSGEQSDLQTPFGVLTYPTGLPDALANLPMFGGIIREGENVAKPFFSSLYRTLSERAPAVGTAEHFLNVARKGGKAEELAWTGLGDWLGAQSGKIKKDDVLKYVEDAMPELRERMIGEPSWADRNKLANLNSQLADGNLPGDVGERVWNERADVANRVKTTPKFTNWTLPGGENQRELVVTMPGKDTTDHFGNWLKNFKMRDILDDLSESEGQDFMLASRLLDDEPMTRDAFSKLPIEYQNGMKRDWAIAHDKFNLEELGEPENQYYVPAGHAYGDPELDVNRLFHARMNDRTTTDGEKTLHLEELQSDWHQAGRREGYGGTPTFDEWLDSRGERNEYEASDESERSYFHDMYDEAGTRSVPDAPFKSTWHELGMKRMLQEAAKGGYDRLTWTTGAQQADRYSLAKVVDKLRYDPATQELTGYKGRGVGPVITQKVAPADLPDYIGQETADKLLATTPKGGPAWVDGGRLQPTRPAYHELTGQDLRLGGEGMKGFYDQMLPRYADKLGKKYGVKSEMVSINGKSSGNAADYIRASIRGADFPGADNVEVHNVLESLADELSSGLHGEHSSPEDVLPIVAGRYRGLQKPISRNAMNSVKKFIDEMPETTLQAHSIRVTPEMRRDLLERGQPLFSVNPPVPLPRVDDKRTTRDLANGMRPAH